MKITDYVKLEELKQMLVKQMGALGLIEQAQTINEEDLKIMIHAMANLNKELTAIKEDDKMNFLIAYIIGLWGRLIIDYGAKLDEL